MKVFSIAIIAVVIIGSAGCRDLTQGIPHGTVDPSYYRTPEGALKLYRGVKLRFVQTEFAELTGELSDEFSPGQSMDLSTYFNRTIKTVDARNIPPNNNTNPYYKLHEARNQIVQAIAMFGLFPEDSLRRYRGELFALHGLVLTYFAEALCSGIPLSRVDFDADFTYAPGISRDSVLKVALAQYDSAASHAAEDSLIGQMIAAGRARVWLQRDSVRIAATYAAQVHPGFSYTLPPVKTARGAYRVSDREGINGLPYRSDADPRTATTISMINPNDGFADTVFYLQKFPSATTPIVLMSAVEAALVVAEGHLVAEQSNWLVHLNTLRTDGTFTVTGTDTTWNAGTGGVKGLRPLTDPALDPIPSGKTVFDVRLDLVMRERAYWLFATGSRLGDLRRLVRHYKRDAESVYPTGNYGRNGSQFNVKYGTDVVFPVPEEERDLNPHYHGCFNLEA